MDKVGKIDWLGSLHCIATESRSTTDLVELKMEESSIRLGNWTPCMSAITKAGEPGLTLRKGSRVRKKDIAAAVKFATSGEASWGDGIGKRGGSSRFGERGR